MWCYDVDTHTAYTHAHAHTHLIPVPFFPFAQTQSQALFPPVSKALANAFGSASYTLGPPEYELRSADLPGARRVLQAATEAMVGSTDGESATASGVAGAAGVGCQAALLPEPFEELVRRLAVRIAAGVAAAARAKGTTSGGGGGRGGRFTEWGALLLRKEVRTLQQGLAALMETDSLNKEFGEVNELVSDKRRVG